MSHAAPILGCWSDQSRLRNMRHDKTFASSERGRYMGDEIATGRVGARLPLRWPQEETGKIPVFTIPATSS
jgi:hypothetical protein